MPGHQKRDDGKSWGDKAGDEDEAVKADEKSDYIRERTIRVKEKSEHGKAVVARSQEIQTDRRPPNGLSSECHLLPTHHARRRARHSSRV